MNAARRLAAATLCVLVGGLVLGGAVALAAEAPETPDAVVVESVTASSATFHGTLNPQQGGRVGTYEPNEYQFLYRASPTECEGGSKAPASPGISLGGGREEVSEGISGLESGAEYTVCLLARNPTTGEEAVGPPVTFTVITGESVSSVLSTSATLEAQLDPQGEDMHYYFQYGTASCTASPSSCTDAPSPPGIDIGSGEGDETATFALGGLTPGTTYHYRVLATNALGTVEGPDETFTTPAAVTGPLSEGCANERLRGEQPYGLELPDCRAYEMVSPVEKGGNDAINVKDYPSRAAVSGEALVFKSLGAFAGAEGSRFETEYLARRGPGGWSTHSIVPPYEAEGIEEGSSYESMIFTPELSAGVAETVLPDPGTTALFNLYLADLAGGSYQSLTGSLDGGQVFYSYIAEGASTDLSHVVFNDYEWIDGRVVEVTVMNNDKPMGGTSVVGGGDPPTGMDKWHAVSADGSRVFFTNYPGGGGASGYGQLYVRENVGQPQSPVEGGRCTASVDACTVEVSASQRTPEDPAGPQLARYWGASADGSRVFFTSYAELTDDAYTGAADNAANLYEYDLEDGHLTDLTVDRADTDGAAVQGVVQISEEGSYVYFVADGALAGEAKPGQPNLYVSHDGGAPRFIATLAEGRENVRAGGGVFVEGDEEDWKPNTSRREDMRLSSGYESQLLHAAAVSPDGTRLAFVSERSLTGYDNRDVSSGRPDDEVYLYDSVSSELVCVSCDPSVARPIGPSSLAHAENRSEAEYMPRDFSEDGNRLFFQSADALVSHDSNGLQDVYEYEGGHVYPISDVAGGHESLFLDASANGNDVFFATADQLLPQDRDDRVDVYDAREGGGFPVSVSAPPCDNGDSCKPPPASQPAVFGTPASATFSGAGNPASITVEPVVQPKPKKKSAKCAAGKKRSHGKCVKSRSTKRTKKSASKGRK